MKKFLLIAASVVGVVLFSVFILWAISPSSATIIDNFKDAKAQQPTVIYDKNGTQLEVSGEGNYRYMPFARIPQYLKNAFVSAQDPNFFAHNGSDLIASIRAQRKKSKGDDQGRYVGYTLTQRFVSSVLYQQPLNIFQKSQVYFGAKKLESAHSKDEIFEYFLNSVEFGEGVRGVETASVYYFGKSCTDINEAEAAFLAALSVLPGDVDVRRNFALIKSRQLLIIQEMAQNKFVNFKDISFWYKKTIKLQSVLGATDEGSGSSAVNQFIFAKLKELGIDQQGIEVHTTLDASRIKMAKALEKSVRDRGIGFSSPVTMQLEILDTDPYTGAIRALVVSGAESMGQTFSLGDQIKDPALPAALASGNDLLSKISWDKPSYYDAYFSSPMDLIAPHQEQIIDYLQSVRIQQVADVPLAEQKISLTDLARISSPFLNEGQFVDPYIITRVKNVAGDVLYERAPTQAEEVLKPQYAFLVKTMWNHYSRYVLKVGTPSTVMSGYLSNQNREACFQVAEGDTDLVSVWAGQNDGRGRFVNKSKGVLESIASHWAYSYDASKKNESQEPPPTGISFKKVRQENWGISAASQVRNIPFVNL